MAISWDTIKSLLWFFGPLLLPKVMGYYRKVTSGSATQGLTVRPVPPRVQRALYLLGLSTLVYLVLSFPLFSPENLFQRTQSRLQIPTDVLFNRISSLRPGNTLTASDEALRAKFVNLESRLLYLQFGPEVLADCPFCNSDDPRSYYYYALPNLLFPHLLNLVILSVATSGLLTGAEGGKWRSTVAVTSTLVASVDLYLVNSYRYQANARATRLSEIDLFYWNMRVYRWVVLALLNSVFAWLLYLSSTNRAFASPPGPAERLETVTQHLLNLKAKLNSTTVIKNTVLRDDELRTQAENFWAVEGRVMKTAMEDREVVDGVKDALENRRIDIQKISREAELYATKIVPPEATSG